MKNIRTQVLLTAILASSLANADPRCNEPTLANPLGGLALRDAYKVLTWADKCKPKLFKITRYKMQLQMWRPLADSEEGTRGGTYFPEFGTPEYEQVRVNVSFPIFFVAGSNTDYWKEMFEPGDTQTRIFRQDCGVVVPDRYNDLAFCVAGCFAPDQNLLFADEKTGTFDWMRIDSAFKKRDFVAAVSQNSTLEHISFVKAKIEDYITDLEPGLRSVLRIDTASGKQVKVTHNHPLLDANGLMRRADSLVVGEALVTHLGQKDAITHISQESFHGRVYNLDVGESSNYKRIVAANGILSGTNWYQNRGSNMLDKIALRANLARAIQDELIESGRGQWDPLQE